MKGCKTELVEKMLEYGKKPEEDDVNETIYKNPAQHS